MTSEVYILCEGFHDRAFWKGLLLHWQCKDPTNEGSVRVCDPWNKGVGQGQYAFKSPSGKFIRLVPVRGSRALLHTQFRSRLDKRRIEALDALIVSGDADSESDADCDHLSLPIVHQWAREVDADATQEGPCIFASDRTPATSLVWKTATAESRAGVPTKQTLERVLCLAMADVYPQRAQPVEDWLASRPEPPEVASPKAHAFSYVAGWYAASSSYEGAIASAWRDKRIAESLMRILNAQDEWAAIKGFLS